jgi:hypothetical protein
MQDAHFGLQDLPDVDNGIALHVEHQIGVAAELAMTQSRQNEQVGVAKRVASKMRLTRALPE